MSKGTIRRVNQKNEVYKTPSPLKSMDLQYERHLSDIHTLPIADGLKDVLINQGFTIRRILQTKPNDLAVYSESRNT